MKKLIKSVVLMLLGALVGISVAGKIGIDKIQKMRSMSNKHLALFLMMRQWVKVKQEGKNLADYFEKNRYGKIAVYGMGYVGETLIDELKKTGITVLYGIDRKVNSLCMDLKIVSIDEDLDEVDAIVVTPITFFDEIEKALSKKVSCPVISLEDVLYEV